MSRNGSTVKVSRFLGVNNTEDPVDLGADEAGTGWLVDALNTDITNSKKVQRRPGFEIVTDHGAVTSAYATKDERDLYTVNSGTLYRVHSMDPLARTSLAAGITSNELHWAEAGNLTFFCGDSKGVISGNDVLAFGIPTPSAPGMTAIGGSLPAGRYLAACVYKDEHGREGGCEGVSEIELTTEGGIQFDVPALSGYVALLYVSALNGDVLFFLTETAGDYNWVSGSPSSIPLDEAQMGGYPPPDNGECIAFHESKIWVSEYDQVSNVSYIHPSKPFWYHLFSLDRYIAVPGRVRMLVSVPPGPGATLIIGTDEAIYAYGPDETLTELADYGVVPGHQCTVMDRKAFFWSVQGVCTALPFQNLTNSAYSVPPGARAGVGVRRYGGMTTLIICTDTSGDADNPR